MTADAPKQASLYGIRIALVSALIAAGGFLVFSYFDHRDWMLRNNPPPGVGGVPDPPWLLALWVGFVLVPWVVSFVLLSIRRRTTRAVGAGVACGVFIPLLVFGVFACFAFPLILLGATEYIPEMALSLIAFVLASLWIVISAIRIGKTSWLAFAPAAVIALVWFAYGNSSLKSEEYKLDRQHEQWKREHPFGELLPPGAPVRLACLYILPESAQSPAIPTSSRTLPRP